MGVEKAAAGVERFPVPVESQDDQGGLSAEQRSAVLGFIAANPGCATKDAAAAAGVRRHQVKDLRRKDPEFDEDYKQARGYATEEQIHQATVKLAIEGVEEPLVSAGKLVKDDDGNVVTVRKYSERLLQTLFNSMTPEGKATLGNKIGLTIDAGDGGVTVQTGVSFEEIAQVLRAAGKEVPALEEPPAGEIVAETDEPAT